jgi:hypothetical protein
MPSARNIVAVGLFLFGTTFLWMTKEFLAPGEKAEGLIWTVTEGLVMVAIVGFSLAAWAVFKQLTWWEPVAFVSAALGLIVLIPYVVGIRSVDGLNDAGVLMNIAIHSLGSAAVLLLVIVPFAHQWLTRRI